MEQSIVLIIGTVWPEPASSAAGSRMLQIIHVLQEADYKIVFASSAAASEYSFDLHSINVETESVELNNGSFDDFIKQLKPAVVLFDRFMTEEQFGWRVAEHCPDAIRIIDTEDLHCLRAARTEAFKLKKDYTSFLNNDSAKREIAAIWRSDLSLIISEFEMNLLTDHYRLDEGLLHYFPFLAAVSEVSLNSFEDRKHFVTIGNFLHEPNRNTVLYLKEAIWPLIRKKLPDAEMHVYGAYPAQRDFQLQNAKEGFLVKGRAEDVNEIMKPARVCLAPIRIGAGLKGKLLDAMLCGTPTVTTSIGAEGMNGGLPWNGIIADEPETFADGAVELYTNKDLWKQSVKNGNEIVKQRFDKKLFEASFLNKLDDLQKNLALHRNNNFTGSMLMHHTMQSTKFMSRWIEEKNRK